MPEPVNEKESKVGEWIASGFFWAMGGALFVGLLELGRRAIQHSKDDEEED